MTLQVHPIALGCMLVVAFGTLIYTYVTSRQQAQQHGYGGGSSNYEYDIPPPLASQTSSKTSLAEDSGPSSRKKRNADQCSICLGCLKLTSTVRKLTCNHVFHAHCINMWLNSNKTCPNCRRPVSI